AANARAQGFADERCKVVIEEVARFDITNDTAWHCDPDRRPAGYRTSQATFSQPPIEVMERLLVANPHAAIKLAPAAGAPPHWQAAEREWLGSRGECRQQVAWFGDLARHPGKRSATVVCEHGRTRTVVEDSTDEAP